MKRFSMLAALLLAVSVSAEEACPVPAYGPDRIKLVPLARGSEVCRAAESLREDFAKLLAAAGFEPGELTLALSPEPDDNAFYTGDFKRVTIQYGYLRQHRSAAVRRATLSHEIGHGVQDREGILAWRGKAPAGAKSTDPLYAAWLERKRIVEAQADAIGLELRLKAGLEDGATNAAADRYGCEIPEAGRALTSTHPEGPQRTYNIHLAKMVLTDGQLKDKSAKIEAMAKGLGSPEKEDSVAYQPSARVSDFDRFGRFQPGRLVADELRMDVPPNDAGPVRQHASFIASAAWKYWVTDNVERAVNAVAYEEGAPDVVMGACLRNMPPVQDRSLAAWARRATNLVVRDWLN